MIDYIKASVFRFNPDKDAKPYFSEYKVETGEEISVLALLSRIHDDIDPELSFRSYCCGLQMCQSCLMRINHKRKLACMTMVKPGEEIIIEPASYPDSHIKDLVTKLIKG